MKQTWRSFWLHPRKIAELKLFFLNLSVEIMMTWADKKYRASPLCWFVGYTMILNITAEEIDWFIRFVKNGIAMDVSSNWCSSLVMKIYFISCMTSYLCRLGKCLHFMPYKELPSKNQPHGEKKYEAIQSIIANFLKNICVSLATGILHFSWSSIHDLEGEPWRSGKSVALLPWGHGFKSWKQPLPEMQGVRRPP
jgi:hypothetical protein